MPEKQSIAELYKIVCNTDTWYYTSYATDLLVGATTYKAAPLDRSENEDKGDFSYTKFTITTPLEAFVAKYLATTPVFPVEITIYQYNLVTFSLFILFQGEVTEVSIYETLQAQVNCEEHHGLKNKKLPTIIFQSFCNHDVFGSGCGLDKSLCETETIITVSGSDLISSDFAAESSGYFTGGFVDYQNDYRWITNHVTNTITLQAPFDSRVQTGATVKAYPGCDGNPATCVNKFNNLNKFLGFPYIPRKNPVIWGV